MHAHTALLKDLAVRTSVRFLEELTADYRHKDFAVRLWDGTEWGDRRRPRFTLVPNHPGALRNMFTSPCEFTLGEAFIDDDFDIEGEIEGAFDLADFLFLHEHSLTEKLQLGSLFARLPATDGHDNHDQGADLSGAVHSKERDRNAVTRHYDVSNEFYKHWLERWYPKVGCLPAAFDSN